MDLVEEQLCQSKTIAVVGLSDDPEHDSHRVASYLQSEGYRVIPVNPLIQESVGEKSYPDVKSVPGPIDMVNILQSPELVLQVVNEAIEAGVRYIWMHDGIIDHQAKQRAEAAGIPVIMDD